jgi:RNA polymerase sigma factor (sigma-70 family)
MAPAAVIPLGTARGAGPTVGPLSDRRLARLASKGDQRAFASIYERHHRDLFRYCRSITGNAEDAGDALQSTMAAALRALPGERREIALRAWLFRIAHNESISLVRRRRPSYELTEASAPTAPGPHAAACTRERVAGLVADMRALPERQRGALVMRELNGLEYGEIGAALHVTGGAARQAVYEARLALTELDEGRDMACDVARRSISARDGRKLRGRRLRAHLRSCHACSDFNEQVGMRRSALQALLPPLPAAAGAAILGSLLGGAAGLGAGASVGAVAGAGSSGLMSLVAGGLSQATGASVAAKGTAAAVAVAIAAGVGTVEVARDVDGPSPRPDASVEERPAKREMAVVPAAAPRSSADAARSRAAPELDGGDRAGARRELGDTSDGALKGRRVAPRELRAPVVKGPVEAPRHLPEAPKAPVPVSAPVSQPAALPVSQPWQQQYTESMRQAQLGMQVGQQVLQQTMQGVQQMMNSMFPAAPPR